MKTYLVENIGCDDTTTFEIGLTDEELKTVLRFIKLNNKNSTYRCMPKIDIYEDYFYDMDFKPVTYEWVNHEYIEARKLNKDMEDE